MQSATTATCSAIFPSIYEHIQVVGQSIMAEHRKDDKLLSYVSISLEELSFYDYYEGDDLLARFRESCRDLRGDVEVIADKTLPVAGLTSNIRTAQSAEGSFYYFGLIPINSEYGYSITADCNIGSREFYEPLFDEIWQSLQYFGNPAAGTDKQQAASNAAVSKQQTTGTANTEQDNNIASSTIPPDGQELWKIGYHTFTLIGERQCYISDGGGELYVKIEAQAPDAIDPETSDIINSYSDRKVYLQFYFKGIYHSGIPTGRFLFEKDSNSTHLNIENNPLQHLPAGLENIPELNLELEKKMTLLDYSYSGADGQGTIPYDDNRFYAKYDPELLSLLENQISAAGLDSFMAGLTNRARKSVALETTEEDTYLEKGNHRFGGLPDLPPGVNYPSFVDAYGEERGLQFIAQINCAAIAHLQDYLPRTGILYFFIEDQEETVPKVLYYDGDISDLQPAKDLNIEPAFIYDDRGIYTPFLARAGKYPGIPFMYNAHTLYPELSDMEEMYDETEQMKNGFKAHSGDPVHSMNSYVFKQHDTPEMEAVNAKKGKPEEWMVLLRVGSDNKTGFQFWDAGEIYFVIHKSDLEKKDFSNVYCGLESS